MPLLSLTLLVVNGGLLPRQGPIEGITFAQRPTQVFLPVREVGDLLGWTVHPDDGKVFLRDKPVWIRKKLFDGTNLMLLSDLANWGVRTAYDGVLEQVDVKVGDDVAVVSIGAKRVHINRKEQELRAWQGSRLVFQTNVSTGARGHETPRGTFEAGPEKSEFRRSSLYNDAPMPWAVQVTGHIFMHGYASVPPRPASHGCIRLPIRGKNAARWFYSWIDIGTPVEIRDSWK